MGDVFSFRRRRFLVPLKLGLGGVIAGMLSDVVFGMLSDSGVAFGILVGAADKILDTPVPGTFGGIMHGCSFVCCNLWRVNDCMIHLSSLQPRPLAS